MFYDKLNGLPEPGTIQETLCLLLYEKRLQQKQALAVLQAVTHSSVALESVQTALKEYITSLRPYVSFDEKDNELESALAELKNAKPFVINVPVGINYAKDGKY